MKQRVTVRKRSLRENENLIRATQDIDLWVRGTPENAERVFDVVAVFGAPTDRLDVADLSQPESRFPC